MNALNKLAILTLTLLALLIACASSTNQEPQVATETPTPTPTLTPTPEPMKFDGKQSFEFLLGQMALGPRYPGSEGHLAVREYIYDELTRMGWEAERQEFVYGNLEGMNLIGRANVGKGDVIILGAHYDTRARADQSPGFENLPVPGAVDGGSGVAVLLEMARTLNLEKIDAELWLAFFDFEDNGSSGIEGWDWIIGSRYMAENLTEPLPAAMVLVDMIGDADQQLYYEQNSDRALREAIWGIAAELGYAEQFIPVDKYTMLDDHIPFLQRGIPAIDIIDFDYPYWHTIEDTADKASAESLERVGLTLQVWLEERR